MRKGLIIIVTILLSVFCNSAKSQNNVWDILTLKNGKGIIKGFISEQVPGETVKIIPAEATLKIDFEDVSGSISSKRIRKDSTTIEVDMVTLKNGTTIEGTITEQSPNKWLTIKTTQLSPQTYQYDKIEKLGKETIKKDDNIFKCYGIIDALKMRNGNVIKGIIIEQTLGSSVKIKTLECKIEIYDVADIVSTSRESYDKNRDIFKQSAFLDIINLKNGSDIKGIIVQQIPNQDIKIETLGSSNFVQKMADVIKLSREKNPYKDELKSDSVKPSIKEPEFIGDCLWVKSLDTIKIVEKKQFTWGNKTHTIIYLNGSAKSETRLPINKEVTFLVKVANPKMAPTDQIHLFKTDYNKWDNKRFIDIKKHSFLSKGADNSKKSSSIAYSFNKKVGEASFEIKFKITEPGEYAIHVDGCDKSFALFGVDNQKVVKKK